MRVQIRMFVINNCVFKTICIHKVTTEVGSDTDMNDKKIDNEKKFEVNLTILELEALV